MAYTIKYTDTNKGVISIEDNTINQDTSLDIPGRNTTSYGSVIAENFLKLLENFANNSAPARPTEGQLWYDTTPGINVLKIYDGTSWVNAGNLKKGDNEPDASTALPGDLWSDTDNNQLYLFTGSGWILVGPEFSDGLATGAKPLVVTGTDEIQYTVLQIEIQGQPIAIISTNSFTPKATILGFTAITPGLNLSSRNISGQGVPKYYGVSEKAENLIVNGNSVAGSNFLRGDTTSSSDFPLIVRNNTGIQVGQDGLISIGIEGTAGIINNLTSGSSIDFRVNNLGTARTVVRIDSTEKVGINNVSPAEALDVTGNIQGSGTIISNGVTQSDSVGSGALQTKGGAGIAKNLYVGGDLNVTGSTNTGNIAPLASNTNTLGTEDLKWASVYATQFVGNLVGNITGTVSGRSGSTNKLAQATTFSLAGDVSSNQILFDGQQGGTTKTFNTTISNTFIADKDEVPTSRIDDEIIINRTSGTPGVFKITQRNLLQAVPTMPIGSVIPYAGTLAPAGWLLCDGSEYRIADYLELFRIVSYNYKDQSLVTSGQFAVPDLRGRQPLGADNMGGTGANRVTNVSADTIGNSGGTEKKNIQVENLPEHEHDLRGPSGDQYYVIRDVQGTPTDAEAIQYDSPTGANAGQAYPTSGGVLTQESLGIPLDVMTPFTTMNYIIYTGVGG